MSLLSRPFPLFDVDDLEAFCCDLVQKSGLELGYHEREDLTSFLISSCWEASDKYDEQRSSFTTFATTVGRRRITDWQRKYKGRTKWNWTAGSESARRVGYIEGQYERKLQEFVSLDERGLDGFESIGSVDSPAHRPLDLLGLLNSRDSNGVPPALKLGDEADAEAAA